MTESIAELLKPRKIKTFNKTSNKVSNSISKIKDKRKPGDKEKIVCKTYSEDRGGSVRTWKQRVGEHKRYVYNKEERCRMQWRQGGHKFHSDEVEILETEKGENSRKMVEVLYKKEVKVLRIKRCRFQPATLVY